MDTDETTGELDRNIDEELLTAIRHFESRVKQSQGVAESVTPIELVKKQHADFERIADSMPDESVLRRLLTLILPLVGESTRVRS